MEEEQVIAAFAALAQETRLRAFRLLVKAGPEGLAAGSLSDALGIPHNTLSFHLGQLSNAGLVTSRRDGRSILYAAEFGFVQGLIRFLVENCCSADIATLRDDPRRNRAVIELTDCCK
jgi:ArsR family transcriptional regulator